MKKPIWSDCKTQKNAVYHPSEVSEDYKRVERAKFGATREVLSLADDDVWGWIGIDPENVERRVKTK